VAYNKTISEITLKIFYIVLNIDTLEILSKVHTFITNTQFSLGFSAWLPATKYIECGKSLRLQPMSSMITSKLKHGKPYG